MTASPYNRRIRFWLAIGVRLVIFSYIFQLIAFDHWQTDMSHIIGVEGSSQHVAHCHGNPSGCADSAGLVSTMLEASLAPAAPAAVLFDFESVHLAPSDAFLPNLGQPPQAA